MDGWIGGEVDGRRLTLSHAADGCLMLGADFSKFPFCKIPFGQLLKDNLQQVVYGLSQVPIDLSSSLNF